MVRNIAGHPLRKIVGRRELPRPAWMTAARRDRREWEFDLECGHRVRRKSYDSSPPPDACYCSLCRHDEVIAGLGHP